MNSPTPNLAPILLFVFDRPLHAEQTLESLMKNELANESLLFIYADGPKTNANTAQLARIAETRQVIRKKSWCKKVTIVEFGENMGVDELTLIGVTKIINEYGKLIVLEDDILTSKGFLRYMNKALHLYENEEKVMSIAGYNFPVKLKQQAPHFIFGGTSSWGWATWKRAWDKFNPDHEALYLALKNNPRLARRFDFKNSFYYLDILKDCSEENKPWDIRWYASVFLSGGYGLWPGTPLVQNIGHDGTGVHEETTQKFQHPALAENVDLHKIPVRENKEARREMIRFFRGLTGKGFFSKIRDKFLP